MCFFSVVCGALFFVGNCERCGTAVRCPVLFGQYKLEAVPPVTLSPGGTGMTCVLYCSFWATVLLTPHILTFYLSGSPSAQYFG